MFDPSSRKQTVHSTQYTELECNLSINLKYISAKSFSGSLLFVIDLRLVVRYSALQLAKHPLHPNSLFA